MVDVPARRRTVLKRAIACLTAGVAAFGLGYLGTQPAAALDADDQLLAEDIHVERNDGDVDAVTVQPELDLGWTNFGGGVEDVELTISAAVAGTPGFDVLFAGPVSDESVTVVTDGFDTADGTATIEVERLDLTSIGSDVRVEDFGGALSPGESKTTTVELTLRVDVTGRQHETVTALETAHFDVTVQNPEGEMSATGRANTGVE